MIFTVTLPKASVWKNRRTDYPRALKMRATFPKGVGAVGTG